MDTLARRNKYSFVFAYQLFKLKKVYFNYQFLADKLRLYEINVRILILLRVPRESALNGEISRHS